MAKRRRQQAVKKPERTLAESVERAGLRQLAESARTKLEKGEKVSRDERSAFTRWERLQADEYGQQYFSAMPKGHVAEICGVQPKTLIEHHDKSGLPYPKSRTAAVDGRAFMRFLWQKFIGGETAASEQSASESQEIAIEFARERLREKQIANRRKELELVKLEEAHVPTAQVEAFAMSLADVTRKKSENAQRSFESEFGPEAAQAVQELFEDIADAWERRALNEFGDGSNEQDSDTAA